MFAKLGEPGDFGNTIGAAGMCGGGQHGGHSMKGAGLEDFLMIGGDHARVSESETMNTLIYADHHWHTAQQPERFPGKACGTQSGGNDGQDRQRSRPAYKLAARFTPVKIRNLTSEGKQLTQERTPQMEFDA